MYCAVMDEGGISVAMGGDWICAFGHFDVIIKVYSQAEKAAHSVAG